MTPPKLARPPNKNPPEQRVPAGMKYLSHCHSSKHVQFGYTMQSNRIQRDENGFGCTGRPCDVVLALFVGGKTNTAGREPA